MNTILLTIVACILLVSCISVSSDAKASSGGDTFTAVDPSSVNITWGNATRRSRTTLVVRDDSIRGELGRNHRDAAELSFVYRGISSKEQPLANGEMRRQIGLKLRAYDQCNVVYVMWHIEPDQGIRVQVKSNPGQNTHKQCGARGYINVKPHWSKPIKPISIDERRTLRATIIGTELQVMADGELVWRGQLPEKAFMFDGPVGLRTDNGNFDIEVRIR